MPFGTPDAPVVLDIDARNKAREAAAAAPVVEVKTPEVEVKVEEKPPVAEVKAPVVEVKEPVVEVKAPVVAPIAEVKPEEVVELKTDLKKIPKPVVADPAKIVPSTEEKVVAPQGETVAEKRLKQIESDSFLQKFIEYKLAGGDPQVYLESQAKDWAKEPDFKILRDQFYASVAVKGLDAEAAEELWSREVSEKYSASITGEYEDGNSKDARIGKQLMKRDAEALRSTNIAEQKKFTFTKAEEKPLVQYDPVKERENILKNESVKTFVADKLVAIGETGYAHEVEDPEAIIGMMTDARDFWKLFRKEDGTVDYGKLTKAFAFAKNPSKYENDILSLGKSLGEEAYLKAKKNTGGIREVNQDKEAPDGKTFVKGDFLKAMREQNQFR